jgi:hypothetical protein
MPKIRSPRARKEAEGREAPAATAAGKKQSSDLMLWYHANKQWLPLVGTVFGGAAVYLLSNVELLKPYMAFLGGLVLIVGSVVYGLMRPEDAPVRVGRNKLMPLVLLVSAATLVAGLVPYLHTNLPGTPRVHATLSRAHPRASFALGDAGLIEVVVHGALRRGSSTAAGGYELSLEHGGKKRRLQGAFKRTYSSRKIRRGKVRIGQSSEFAFHVSQVASMGKGRYTLELVDVDASLENYLRVKVYDTWYTEKTLITTLVALVVLGFLVDIASTRVKHRTRLATGALAAVGFSVYFTRRYTPDSAMSAVLGGAFVAIIAAWLGGAVLSFLTQRIGGEPRAVKAAARDEDD